MNLSMIPEIAANGTMEAAAAATWGLERIGADNRGSKLGNGVTIFVLDTGVRTTHWEFGSRAESFMDMSVGWNRQCYGSLTCAEDRQGHGTHCAGSAAGRNLGVAPMAQVRSIKVLADD